MRDKESLSINRLKFGALKKDEIIEFETNDFKGENRWTYLFYITEPGEWPKGNLWAIGPDGAITEQIHTVFHGCGSWTTQKQNPVQQQFGTAFTPLWGELVIGCYATFDNPTAPQGERITLNDKVASFKVASPHDYEPVN